MCFVVVLWDLTLSPQEINCNFNQILRFDGSVRLMFEYNKCFSYEFCVRSLQVWLLFVLVSLTIFCKRVCFGCFWGFGKHKTKCCQLICIRAYLICYFWNTRSHWSCCIQLKYDQTQWMITFSKFSIAIPLGLCRLFFLFSVIYSLALDLNTN